MAAIEARSLRKEFGDIVALRGIDLTVEKGEVFGFLGPNGAGKSTTIDLLLDYIRPTEGTATVFGLDTQKETRAVRQRIGVLPDAYHLDGHLTARQHVEFGIESKDSGEDPMDLLARVSLDTVPDRRVDGFSKGMLQRLVLAMALVGKPELLILDEPSTGLDPNGARQMREIVREETSRGATVFFSSHILGQVEAVCDRVGILNDGVLVAQDSIDGLQDSFGANGTVEVRLDQRPDGALDSVRALDGVSDVTINTERGTVSVTCADEQKITVLDALREDGARILDFETTAVSLDDLFASYTRGHP